MTDQMKLNIVLGLLLMICRNVLAISLNCGYLGLGYGPLPLKPN